MRCLSFVLILGLFGLLGFDAKALASDSLDELSFQRIKHFSPRADPKLVQAILDNRGFLRAAGITTPARVSQFLAQIATETGGLRRIEEDLSYRTEARLRKVFGKRITHNIALRLMRNPQATANFVYAHRNGNGGEESHDGWTYRGSGFIQLTGRRNFFLRGKEIPLPLLEQPELARRPKEGLQAATSYWTARDINQAADQGSVKAVRVLVNGKRAIGYNESLIWYGRAVAAVGLHGQESGAEGPNSDSIRGLVGALQDEGLIKAGPEETLPDQETIKKAIRLYQKRNGLQPTGELDSRTLYSVTDPQRWRDYSESTYDVTGGSNGSEAGISSDNAVEFDLASGAVRDLSTPEGQLVDLASNSAKGSGPPAEAGQLSEDSLLALKKASPIYANYESGSKNADGHDNGFVPFSVIEPDTRKVVTQTTVLPNRTVVLISFADGREGTTYRCTGTMISANTVLTAGHCVFDGDPKGNWHKDFHVFPARNGPVAPFPTCGAKKLFALTGWVGSSDPDQARWFDLGAIKLDCNVGQETGWVSLSASTDSQLKGESLVVGYPCDKTPEGRQWESKDRIRVSTERKLFYQNDTYGCMSGAPVFVGGKLVAVHTSGLYGEEPWASNNSGTRITSSDIAALLAWIRD